MKNRFLTGRKLKAKLDSMTEEELNFIILSEGCDCTGATCEVEIDHRSKTIEIQRHENYQGGGWPEQTSKEGK